MATRSGTSKTPKGTGASAFHTVALVLQGGGALGAYQAGVLEGLAEAAIEPHWVAGVSIGAIQAALIAGNAPHERMARLREFWTTVCQPAHFQPTAAWFEAAIEPLGGAARQALNSWHAWRALVEGQRGFFHPRGWAPWLGLHDTPASASFYDTTPLKQTLQAMVDFERLNHPSSMRVTVAAVNVANGNFEIFDNRQGRWRERLRAEHFMASGALPPGFGAVEIEGQHYWDGGLVSNTPLSQVLAASHQRHTLVFQVDLWSARGALPTNVIDAQERQKDIQYSSRTRMVTDQLAHELRLRRMLRELLEHVPAKVREHNHWCLRAAREASDRRVKVIHLIYQDKEWDGLAKDYEFGLLTMNNHWASGLEDIRSTLKHHDWMSLPDIDEPFVTHDVHRKIKAAP
jgi:NTE family protein